MELSDVLSDKPPETPPVEVTAEPEVKVEAKTEVPRTPEGKFAKVEPEPKAEPEPKEELTPKEKAAFAKAADETRKRQALERKVAELEARAPAPQPVQTEQPKTFWDDPEGNLRAHEQRVTQENTTTKLNVFEAMARQRHTDFDEKIGQFGELVKVNPVLQQQWLSAPDPAEFAYLIGKQQLDRKLWEESGGVEGVRKSVEAEIRAKVEAEFKAKEDERKKLGANLPKSLSDVPGTGGGAAPTWGGPASLDSVLKH